MHAVVGELLGGQDHLAQRLPRSVAHEHLEPAAVAAGEGADLQAHAGEAIVRARHLLLEAPAVDELAGRDLRAVVAHGRAYKGGERRRRRSRNGTAGEPRPREPHRLADDPLGQPAARDEPVDRPRKPAQQLDASAGDLHELVHVGLERTALPGSSARKQPRPPGGDRALVALALERFGCRSHALCDDVQLALEILPHLSEEHDRLPEDRSVRRQETGALER